MFHGTDSEGSLYSDITDIFFCDKEQIPIEGSTVPYYKQWFYSYPQYFLGKQKSYLKQVTVFVAWI